MADDEQQQAEESTEPKKKSPMMLFGVVGVLMLLEALGVYVLVTMTGPKSSEASVDIKTIEDDAERAVELLLVEDRFINTSTGRPWQWAATVYMKIKNKNLERVQEEMASREAEIKEGIGQIIATAKDRHLKEPNLETVKRQIDAFVQEIFGVDAEGEPRVERIVIPRFIPSPLDF